MTAPTIELNIRLDVMGNSSNFNHALKREVNEISAGQNRIGANIYGNQEKIDDVSFIGGKFYVVLPFAARL